MRRYRWSFATWSRQWPLHTSIRARNASGAGAWLTGNRTRPASAETRDSDLSAHAIDGLAHWTTIIVWNVEVGF